MGRDPREVVASRELEDKFYPEQSYEPACARQPARTSLASRHGIEDVLAADAISGDRHEDPLQRRRRSTILFRMAPGGVVPLHEHTALEQTYMLEGSLEDAEGSCGAGDFVWRPGGNIMLRMRPTARHSWRSSTGRTGFSTGRSFSRRGNRRVEPDWGRTRQAPGLCARPSHCLRPGQAVNVVAGDRDRSARRVPRRWKARVDQRCF
jgi:hypothetical protein